jgi:threonine dehydrogenase-like Zn-dependent dehydrogenase
MRAIVLDRPAASKWPRCQIPRRGPARSWSRWIAAGSAAPADAAIAVSPFRVYNDELTIVGSMAVLRSFGAAVDLLASGAVDPGPLLGEPLPLEGFGAAVDHVRAGHGIKWHIRP